MARLDYQRVPAEDPRDAAHTASAVDVRRIRWFNAVSLVIMLVSFIALSVFYSTRRALRAFTYEVVLQGYEFSYDTLEHWHVEDPVGNFNPTVALGSFALVAAGMNVLNFVWAERVVLWVKEGCQWLRWTDYMITSSTVILTVTALCRIFSVSGMATIVALYFACTLFSVCTECYQASAAPNSRYLTALYTVGYLVTLAAAWFCMFESFLASDRLSEGAFKPTAREHFVFYLSFALSCFFTVVFLGKTVCIWFAKDTGAHLTKHGVLYEIFFLTLSIIGKIIIAWNILANTAEVAGFALLPEPAPSYSRWTLMATVSGLIVWTIARITASGVSTTPVWGTRAHQHPQVLRTYAQAAAGAVALRLATAVIGIVALDDARNKGWLAGLLLGLHALFEVALVALRERAPHGSRRAQWAAAVAAWGAWAAYTAYVVVGGVYAPAGGVRGALIGLGAVVSLYLLVFEAVIFPTHMM
jgi:hypothetical protein